MGSTSSTSSSHRRRARRGAGDQLCGTILAAAKSLLAETGSADAVSIRAVADRVGVTPPSIYLHFADKDALIDAVVADVFTELHDAMSAASEDADLPPLERLCQQGLAYVRFVLRAPEHYRLATTSVHTKAGRADQVLQASAFAVFAETIVGCMRAGIFAEGDPTPVALELWAAAHGIASLLIAKPDLPWGDPMEVAYRVMRAAAVGRSVSDYLGDPDPAEFAAWHARLDRGQTE